MSETPFFQRCPYPLRRIARIFSARLLGVSTLLSAACTPAPTDAPSGDAGTATAPSFDVLFETYFAAGTSGHCATAGCHADPGHNVWLCTDAQTCYRGMIEVGLIDPTDPTHSEVADPIHSPLTWINPQGGNMPLDAQGANEAARIAIQAWIATGAAEH